MKPSALALFLLALAVSAPAQSSINWSSLNGGGGAQVSANYVVNFTAGQVDGASGALTSASYRVEPGFWAEEDMGPYTGLPALSIARSGANVVITWPSPSTGFILEHTDSLGVLPAAWTATSGTVSDNGSSKSITLSPVVARRFYRLRHP